MDYQEEWGRREAPRRFSGQHSINNPTVVSGVKYWSCKKCDWYTWAQVSVGEEVEAAEYAAWMHATKPTLVVPHSSDILLPARLRRTDRRS